MQANDWGPFKASPRNKRREKEKERERNAGPKEEIIFIVAGSRLTFCKQATERDVNSRHSPLSDLRAGVTLHYRYYDSLEYVVTTPRLIEAAKPPRSLKSGFRLSFADQTLLSISPDVISAQKCARILLPD